jgi:hypothetical protein
LSKPGQAVDVDVGMIRSATGQGGKTEEDSWLDQRVVLNASKYAVVRQARVYVRVRYLLVTI